MEEREPFLSLERRFGDLLLSVVVADDGKREGMWRDPMGDLADRLFPQDGQQAFAAAHGYLLLVHGEVEAVLKKQSDPVADLWFLQEALAAAHSQIPRPDPARLPRASQAPGHRAAASSGSASGSRSPDSSGNREATDGDSRQGRQQEAGARRRTGASRPHPEEDTGRKRRTDEAVDPWSGTDPWTLLGITGEVTLAEGRKAFRALIAQYHPDKVQHLAPEFRELAEKRTRQIVAAWEEIEQALK